jgi:hypothetical protein
MSCFCHGREMRFFIFYFLEGNKINKSLPKKKISAVSSFFFKKKRKLERK